MKNSRTHLQILTLICGLALACSEKDDDKDKGGRGGNDGGGEFGGGKATVRLKSTTLQQASLLAGEEAETCSAQIDVEHIDGVCLTPTEVSGSAHFIDASDGSLTGTHEDSARIVKAGATSSTDSQGKIIDTSEFSLNDNDTFNGTNELFSAYERKPTYTQITFETAFLKTKFASKGKFVSMLLVTHPQPFVDSDLVNTDPCKLTDDQKQMQRYKDADIFASMAFNRGDYLFCVKDAATDACQPEDYKWFDLDAGTLVASRPTNPRVNQWFIFDEATCQAEGDRHNFSLSGVKFIATLDKKFQLYADFSHGQGSAQWPDGSQPFSNERDTTTDEFADPYLLYYYIPDGEEAVEGTALEVTLDFDVSRMLMVQMDTTEYASATLEDVLKVIDTKTNIGFDNKGKKSEVGYNPAEMSGLNVTANISVTGGRERPAE